MIDRYLTCERYLKSYNKGDKTVVVNLDTPEHICITEVDTYYHNASGWGAPTHRSNYLVGPVADTLHAYEELGYTPEELKKIIEEHKRYKEVDLGIKKLQLNAMYGTTAFTNLESKIIKELRDARRMAEERRYIDTDIAVTQMIFDKTDYAKKVKEAVLLGDWAKKNSIKPDLKPTPAKPEPKSNPAPVVDRAIFNDPATIVFWKDGTKTVVKCSENDIYDPEKGLAMAFAKKMFGNDNTFHKHFKKWLPKEEPRVLEIKINCNGSEATKQIVTLQQRLYRALGYFGGKK